MPANAVVRTISGDGTFLYVGGDFTLFNGQNRKNFAKIEIVSKSIDTSFVPEPNGQVYASCLDEINGRIYLGGNFQMAGGIYRRNTAKILTQTGLVDETFVSDTNNSVNALAYDNTGSIFLGGSFNRVNGVLKTCIAKVSAATGALDTGFNISVSGGAYAVRALAYDQGTGMMFAGGDFNLVNGISRISLIRFDPINGSVDNTFRPIDGTQPVTGPVNAADINAILLEGDSLYFAGFTNKSPVYKINKLNAEYDINFWVNSMEIQGNVFSLALSGDNIYAANDYGVYKLDKYTGVSDLAFHLTNGITGTIYSVAVRDQWLYVGGLFAEGNKYSLARIDLATGFIDNAFNPAPGNYVYSLMTEQNRVHVGGSFTKISSTANSAYAVLYTGNAPSPTNTHTITMTRTPTLTRTFTITKTHTITPENPDTLTVTPTDTVTLTQSLTKTITVTATNTRTITLTMTDTPFFTVTVTLTKTTPPAMPTPSYTRTPGGYYTILDAPAINGIVYTITRTASAVYLGGEFTRAGPSTGQGIVLDNTGALIPGFPKIAGGKILAAVSDGNGGWFIGGTFKYVNGQPRNKLAHIYGNGSLDPVLTIGVGTYFEETIYCLAYDGYYLYAGTNYSISGRQYIAKINPVSNSIDAGFIPVLNERVNNMLIDGSDIYIAGYFTSVNGQARERIAKLNRFTGVLDPLFISNHNGTIYSMEYDSGRLYIAGSFTNAGGKARNNIAKLDAITGIADPVFNPAPNGQVNSISTNGTMIYIGGNFVTVAGSQRKYIAAINADSGNINQAFNPSSGNTVNAVCVEGTKLYAGGSFLNIGGQLRNYAAKLDCVTGAVDSAYDPNPNNPVTLIKTDGNSHMMSGDFTGIGGYVRNNIVKLDASGMVIDSAFNPDTDGAVRKIVPDYEGNVFISGGFKKVGGIERYGVAKVNDANGAVDYGFAPAFQYWPSEMIYKNGYVYAVKGSGTINGAPAPPLVKINAQTGQLDSGYGLNLAQIYSNVWTEAYDADSAYIANPDYYYKIDLESGIETVIGERAGYGKGQIDETYIYFPVRNSYFSGIYRYGGARVSKNNIRNLDQYFDPYVSNINTFGIDETNVFSGGAILRKTYKVNGANDSTFDPYFDGQINALSSSGTTMFAGGSFKEFHRMPAQGYCVMHIGVPPTLTNTPFLTPTGTATVTKTRTATRTITQTPETTFAVTRTPTNTITATRTIDVSGMSATPTRTNTQECTATPTFTITMVPVFPTMTFTPSGAVRILDNIVTNGVVNAITATADSVYLGGYFTEAGTNIGNAVMLNLGDTSLIPEFPKVAGEVLAVIPDRDGGWYIGGNFTGVAGMPRNKIAHIFANYALDPDFIPPAINGDVSALAFNGSDLFVGGGFGEVGGNINYRGVIKIDPKTGQLRTDFMYRISSAVNSLVCDGASLYAGGDISSINGASIPPKILKFNTATGELDNTFMVTVSQVNAMVLNGGKLYIAGAFTTVNSILRRRAARVDALTGEVDPQYNPDINGTVNCMAVTDDAVYLGGYFSSVNGIGRSYVAKIDKAGGALDIGFNSYLENTVFGQEVYAMAVDGQNLFIGGGIESAEDSSLKYLVNADKDTGVIKPSFDLKINGSAKVLWSDGARLFTGGGFYGKDMIKANGIVKINVPDGTINNDFKPLLAAYSDGTGAADVSNLALHSSGLFVWGSFHYANGYYRQHSVKLNADSGKTVLNFNADLSGVKTALFDGNIMFVGGTFSSINGSAIAGCAKINAITGAVDTFFNPGIAYSGSHTVYKLALDGDNLYIGGVFSKVGGQTRRGLARVSATDGSLDYDFNAPVYSVTDMVFNNGSLFVACDPTNGVFRKLDAASGNAVPSFNPVIDSGITSLVFNGTHLYAGGYFTLVNGAPARRLARFDPQTGERDMGFSAGVDNKIEVLALAPDGTSLYFGGTFTEAGYLPRSKYASYYLGIQPTATFTLTITPTPTITLTGTVTETGTHTFTETVTASVTVSQTITLTLTQTESATETKTHTITETETQSPTSTQTQTVTDTYTCTETITITVTGTETMTHTATDTITQTCTATATVTVTYTETNTMTVTNTPFFSATITGTQTETVTKTVTSTPSSSCTVTVTGSCTETVTFTPTNTSSHTVTPTVTLTQENTATPTITPTEEPAPEWNVTSIKGNVLSYPNPSKGVLKVAIKDQKDADYVELSVYTGSLRLILRKTYKVKPEGIYSLNIAKPANGTYILRTRLTAKTKEIFKDTRYIVVIK